MFVDASAIVAMIKPEEDGEALSAKLERSDRRLTSPIAVLEAVISLSRQKGVPSPVAETLVLALLKRNKVAIRPIEAETGALAVEAHTRYGQGSGHPARLNLGDCFAYAMARQHGVRLLYKGNDFAATDLA